MHRQQTNTDCEQWLRRVRDAVIEAATSGATAEQIATQVADGLCEADRIAAIWASPDMPKQLAA